MTALDLNIDSVATYDDGRSFGSTGPYELLRGRLSIVVDPKNAANSRITDIQFAERQADGRVHLKADALILQPIETERGNGALLAVPPNRGYVGDLPFSLVDSMTDPCDLRSGDGFLLRRGWSVAWIGWQWDVSRYGNLLGCTVPEALDAAGNPIAGWTNLMFTPVSTLPYHPLNSPLPGWSPEMPDPTSGRYPTVDVNDAEATLTEACHGHDPRPIPRDAWKFAREHDGTVIADDSNVWLSGGFRGGRTYELHYRTRACPVVGTGLLSFRDAISFLRNGSDVRDSPLTARVEHVLGWGVSQSGRFLREFLHAGCNIDEFGRRVLDAALPFVAGASRGEFNERYGKPGELFAPGLGQTPPFALDSTSAGGGLLDTQRSVGQSPKVVIVNSGSEYWRGDGAHTHISTDGTHDLSEQADTRVYLIAGTDHVSGTHMPFDSQRSLPNRLSPLLVWRALIEATRLWVAAGIPPPPSQVPRVSDGTAVPREHVLARFGELRDVLVPTTDEIPTRHVLDLGPEADRGIIRSPIGLGVEFISLVSDVDRDLNEVAGIRTVDVTVPLSTHIPWVSPRALGDDYVRLASLLGASVPLARTEADRRSNGDPRPSLAKRYASRGEYLDRVRTASKRLVAARFLLPEDVDLVLESAAKAIR